MAPDFDSLKVRLFQVRLREEILAEECETVLKRTRLARHQLVCTNVLRDSLEEDLLDDIDAVIVGGAGAYSVTVTYQWTKPLLRLTRAIADHNLPLFGSCWGHQLLGRAFGGKVVHDPDRAEMGCGSVRLTPEGRDDELFGTFPSSFKANMGHHDRILNLPPGFVELAENDICPFQAIRMEGKPIYGTQFHSELDADAERKRIVTYRHLYPSLQPEDDFRRIMDSLEETTEVDSLLHRFLLTFAVRKPA